MVYDQKKSIFFTKSLIVSESKVIYWECEL